MSASPRRLLRVAYDGADFAGWQLQADRATVQGELERALGGILGEPVRVQGAGRTDAGVHALAQAAHFDDPRGLPLARLRGALNAALPASIRVLHADHVPADFHALHDACRKTYAYQLHLSREPGGQRAVEHSVPPERRRHFHAVRADLDLLAMRRAAALLEGRHDFTVLSKAMPAGRSTLKHLGRVRVLRIPRGLRLVFHGEGFLYGMVRLASGLLVEVGRGRRRADDVPDLLASRDRAQAPASLPAHGLFLCRVDYPPERLPDAASRVDACYPDRT
ncbi:MAG: tRNA pseudouridine synthase A [Planctomycetota bacterium]|nr:MAG: tRNA pseudouridine synthase A [Planctomycetota bacterium]